MCQSNASDNALDEDVGGDGEDGSHNSPPDFKPLKVTSIVFARAATLRP